jgi:hypothetical protein
MCVNAVAMEDAIAGHAAGVQLSRKPRNTTSLDANFFLDDVSYVYGFCHNEQLFSFVKKQNYDK